MWKVIVVWTEVSNGGPVVCVVLETGTVGGGCVVCGVGGLLCVSEVVCTTGVPVPPMVDLLDIVVRGSDVG